MFCHFCQSLLIIIEFFGWKRKFSLTWLFSFEFYGPPILSDKFQIHYFNGLWKIKKIYIDVTWQRFFYFYFLLSLFFFNFSFLVQSNKMIELKCLMLNAQCFDCIIFISNQYTWTDFVSFLSFQIYHVSRIRKKKKKYDDVCWLLVNEVANLLRPIEFESTDFFFFHFFIFILFLGSFYLCCCIYTIYLCFVHNTIDRISP